MTLLTFIGAAAMPSGSLQRLTISGAGTEAANGTWIQHVDGSSYLAGDSGTAAVYRPLEGTFDSDFGAVEYSPSHHCWEIHVNGEGVNGTYYSGEDVANPWQVTTWISDGGVDPVPTVVQG